MLFNLALGRAVVTKVESSVGDGTVGDKVESTGAVGHKVESSGAASTVAKVTHSFHN